MLNALFRREALDPKAWEGERRGNTSIPVRLPAQGSGNYGVVSRVLDLLADRPRSNHLEWLIGWYTGQTRGEIGHCARETLSATYADAHLVPALVLLLLAQKSAAVRPLAAPVAEFLENELALSVIHRDGARRVVSASTRAMTGMSDARDQWVAMVLGETLPHRGRGFRVLKFPESATWLDPELVADCRSFVDFREIGPRLGAVLDSTRTVCGELHCHIYERGHVSYYPEGPWCYAAPQPAAIGFVDGREPVLFNPAQDFRKSGIKGYGSAVTTLEDGILRSHGEGSRGPWERDANLSGLRLGDLREIRVIRRVE
jgi:hypothetical protein